MRIISRQWIEHSHAGGLVVSCVPSHDDQVVDESRGGNLLVQGVFRVRYAQPPPDVSRVCLERQNRVAVLCRHPLQPTFESLGLRSIAAVSNAFYTLTQLTQRNHGRLGPAHLRGGSLPLGVLRVTPSCCCVGAAALSCATVSCCSC